MHFNLGAMEIRVQELNMTLSDPEVWGDPDKMNKLNAELKEKGFLTIAGRVNKQYFMEKTCYGTAENRERE